MGTNFRVDGPKFVSTSGNAEQKKCLRPFGLRDRRPISQPGTSIERDGQIFPSSGNRCSTNGFVLPSPPDGSRSDEHPVFEVEETRGEEALPRIIPAGCIAYRHVTSPNSSDSVSSGSVRLGVDQNRARSDSGSVKLGLGQARTRLGPDSVRLGCGEARTRLDSGSGRLGSGSVSFRLSHVGAQLDR